MSKPEKVISINTKTNPAEASERIMRGVDLIGNAVRITLGPCGQNFLLEKNGTHITNDGITIARQIQAKDEIEELAVRVVRDGAIKTNEQAGDGTTTAITLTQAIMTACQRYLPSRGKIATRSQNELKNAILEEAEFAIGLLEKTAKPIKTLEELISVARVSVEDENLAKLIGQAQFDVGKNGVLIPEETNEEVCSVERVSGIRIDNGMGVSTMMNDIEKQRLVTKSESPVVLLTNHTINSIAPIAAILTEIHQAYSGQREIVLVARAYSSEAIKDIMENNNNGIRIYPFQAPYVNQREVMKDMEAVLGGRYIHDEEASLEDITASDFGVAEKVIGYRYSAIFIGTKDATERIKTLKEELQGEQSKFMQKGIRERIAQLENGFGVVKVGSTSDADRKYKFDKVEDAVNTVRAAYQEGTVEGAGIALSKIADELVKKFGSDSILGVALKAPYKQIQENAGGKLVIEKWVRNALVTDRAALKNSSRVAADLINTGGSIATEKIKPMTQLLESLQASDQ